MVVSAREAQAGGRLQLLAEDARVPEAARQYKADLMRAAGLEVEPEPEPAPVVVAPTPAAAAQVVPQSVIAHQLANPFLAPDYEAAAQRVAARALRLAAGSRSVRCSTPSTAPPPVSGHPVLVVAPNVDKTN